MTSSRSGCRILLVDDHDDSRVLFAIVLEENGHDVTVASDGQEALVSLLSGEFDVAVVDIGLPERDGYEVARLARVGLGPRTPYLIAVTGHARAADREDAFTAGFDEHLPKPVTPDRLLAAVNEALMIDDSSVG